MKENDLKVLNNSYIGFKVVEVFYDSQCDIHRKRKAKCVCGCGEEFISRVDQLKDRRGCPACGCKHGGRKRLLPNKMAAKLRYYKDYIHNAKARNNEFELTLEDFEKIISDNCYYCGTPPQDQSYLSGSAKNYNKFYANGVDRMDNSKGYTLDNVVACCTKCNMMKKVLSINEFLDHICNIYEYQKI